MSDKVVYTESAQRKLEEARSRLNNKQFERVLEICRQRGSVSTDSTMLFDSSMRDSVQDGAVQVSNEVVSEAIREVKGSDTL